MKALILCLCFGFVGCQKSERILEYYYGDRVYAHSGFYMGKTGVVVAYDDSIKCIGYVMKVKFDDGEYSYVCQEHLIPEERVK